MRLVAITVLALATHAHAQSPQEQEADAVFRQGKALMAQNKIADACAAFDKSQQLAPAVTTVLNQANCREKNGQLATAHQLFADAQTQASKAKDKDTKSLGKVAGQRATALAARLSTLAVVVSAEPRSAGFEVLIDGAVLPSARWGKATPIDGGNYKITARARGFAEWSKTIRVEVERDKQRVEIPELVATPEAVLPGPDGSDPRRAPEPIDEPTEASRSSAVPIVLGGTAIVLFGGAIGFELWGRSIYGDAEIEPDDARQRTLWKSANTRRYIAQGAAVAGVACAGLAVWMLLRGPAAERSTTASRTLRIDPLVNPSSATVWVTGQF